LLQLIATPAEWLGPQVDIPGGEDVEGQERCRRDRGRRPSAPAIGQPWREGPEVQPVIAPYHQLSVDDRAGGQLLARCPDDVGEPGRQVRASA